MEFEFSWDDFQRRYFLTSRESKARKTPATRVSSITPRIGRASGIKSKGLRIYRNPRNPPVKVPKGICRYFRFARSRNMEGVADRREGISVIFGIRDGRLICGSSQIPSKVGSC